jgi:hypothetical protein
MRRWMLGVFVFVLACPVLAHGQARTMSPSTALLTAATTTVASSAHKPITVPRTFQAFGETSAGAGASTIVIEVSDIENPATDADWILMGTITLTLGTTRTTDGFVSNAAWRNVRARITAISGTNATVSVRMGN